MARKRVSLPTQGGLACVPSLPLLQGSSSQKGPTCFWWEPTFVFPMVGRVEVPRVLGRHWVPRLNSLPLGFPSNMGLGAGGSPKGTRPVSPLHLGGQKPLYPDLGLKTSFTQLGFSFLRSLPCFAGPGRALRAPLCQNSSWIPVCFCLSVAP